MTDPLGRNRLADAASPYLRQHADNPVNWQPWDETALAAARERDRPIFLSVGYAACHWCHVMADESFEDQGVAEVLNEHYVPIKVDREERPDVDRVYQTICQLVTRGGGWPLSVWLTPDGRPFYVGTYFPTASRGDRPGFRELATGLAEAWETDRDEIDRRADQWMDAIRGEVETVDAPEAPVEGTAVDDDLLADAAGAALRSADREQGGFGSSGPKFPQPARLHLLLRAADRTGRDAFRAVAVETLDAMANGGMYDHLGGGFHRYATDRDWTVPHFEKMLYDNAELPRVYLAGYQVTGEERYATVARETFAFLDRELTHPDGGFYSTLDAQSERDGDRSEGAFYVWTPEEVHDVLDDAAADRFCARYGVSTAGNFEGRTVLTIDRSLGDLADEFEESVADLEATLETARADLFAARADRPRPRRDEKVLAGWNGLAIHALAEAGLVLDPSYADRAVEALGFVKDRLWDGDRLARRFEGGDVGVAGTLDDYAFLARGALALYEATGAVSHLDFALALGRRIVEDFHDPETGALYLTAADATDLAVRPQDLADQSTPSAAGVAVEVLLALDRFAPDEAFATVADRAVDTYRSRIRSNPLQHASLALAADRAAREFLELTVVADELPTAWRETVSATYLPDRLLSIRPAGLEPWLETLGLETAPPVWADRGQVADAPTVYACRGRTCSRPLTDIDAALSWAAERPDGTTTE